MNKPFSQACVNNREPIREIIHPYVKAGGSLLEIGSGTGQHGAYISDIYPNLNWQTSDQKDYLAGIEAWVIEADRSNFIAPFELNINTITWNQDKVDFVFSANTAHIMSWEEVTKLFNFIPECLKSSGYFFLYGPFNYQGKFTSESNARFNDWLKEQAPHRAIRDFEKINELALNNHLNLVSDNAMPANNRLLIWQST